MTLHCYLPCTDAQFERLPRKLSDYAQWQASETELNPFLGRFHWVLQTQPHLQAAGVDSRLTNRPGEAGILYSHVECLPYGIRPSKKQLLIAALVDKDVPLPYAFLHVTHNPVQRLPFFPASLHQPVAAVRIDSAESHARRPIRECPLCGKSRKSPSIFFEHIVPG